MSKNILRSDQLVRKFGISLLAIFLFTGSAFAIMRAAGMRWSPGGAPQASPGEGNVEFNFGDKYLPDDPATGDVDMNNYKIASLKTPVVGTDAVNKDYVDSLMGGGNGGWGKQLCSRTGDYNNLQAFCFGPVVNKVGDTYFYVDVSTYREEGTLSHGRRIIGVVTEGECFDGYHLYPTRKEGGYWTINGLPAQFGFQENYTYANESGYIAHNFNYPENINLCVRPHYTVDGPGWLYSANVVFHDYASFMGNYKDGGVYKRCFNPECWGSTSQQMDVPSTYVPYDGYDWYILDEFGMY